MKNVLQLLVMFLSLMINTTLLHAQWTETDGSDDDNITCFAVSSTSLFAGTSDMGVIRSTDNGASWKEVSQGISDAPINALVMNGTNLFAGTSGDGVRLSTTNGKTWSNVNTGLTDNFVESLAVKGSQIFAGTHNGGVFVSYDNGGGWKYLGLADLYVEAIAICGTQLYVGGDKGIFRSINNGTNWNPKHTGLTNKQVSSFVVADTFLFAGTRGGGVFVSTNNDARWTPMNNGLTNKNILSLAVSGSNLYAGTHGGGVFLSTDNGNSWTAINTGLANMSIHALAADSNNLFAGTREGVWRRPTSELTTSISEEGGPSDFSTHYRLDQNFPNPFTQMTTLRFSLPRAEYVSMKIFSLQGEEVANLVSENVSAGTFQVDWNAEDLPGGVYICHLQAGSFSQTSKLLLLK